MKLLPLVNLPNNSEPQGTYQRQLSVKLNEYLNQLRTTVNQLVENYNMALDSVSGALQVIDYEHARVHSGKAFLVNGKHSITNGSTDYYLLKVPANSYPHLRNVEVTASAGPMDIYLFEAPTTTNDGTGMTEVNYNRNSANTPSMTVFADPTVTVDGTELEYLIVTGTKHDAGSGMNAQTEFVLKPSTNYLVKITNNSGSTVTYALKLFWYEIG
jgi:hypothetical protein